MENDLSGKYATLHEPELGHTRILIIEPVDFKWLVEICGCGKQIEKYEDEFDVDED